MFDILTHFTFHILVYKKFNSDFFFSIFYFLHEHARALFSRKAPNFSPRIISF